MLAAAEVPFHLEFCFQVDIFVSHHIIDIQTLSKIMKNCISKMDFYVSPMIAIEAIESEGLLCASGGHEDLIVDDSWQDFLEED